MFPVYFWRTYEGYVMFTFKKCLIALSINLAVVSSGFACTTLLVGNEASADGSMLVARSADSDALKAQHFVIHPAKRIRPGYTAPKHITVRMTLPAATQKLAALYHCSKLENPTARRDRI